MLKIIKSGNILTYNDITGEWNVCNESIRDLTYSSPENLCELEEGLTLGDIFLLIESYKEFFVDIYGSILIDIIEEMNKDGEPLEKIKYLEIAWNVEEIEGYLDEQLLLNAWGEDEDPSSDFVTEKDELGNINYTVSLMPVNKLKNILIKTNDKYEIFKIDTDLTEKHVSGDENVEYEDTSEVIFKTKKGFTLVDILDAVFFEITLHGSPSQRDAFKDDMLSMINDIKEDSVKNFKNNEHSSKLNSDESNTEDDTINEIDNILNELDKEE